MIVWTTTPLIKYTEHGEDRSSGGTKFTFVSTYGLVSRVNRQVVEVRSRRLESLVSSVAGEVSRPAKAGMKNGLRLVVCLNLDW